MATLRAFTIRKLEPQKHPVQNAKRYEATRGRSSWLPNSADQTSHLEKDVWNDGFEVRMRMRQSKEFEKPKPTAAARMHHNIQTDGAHYTQIDETRNRQERRLKPEEIQKLMKARGRPEPDINLGYQTDDTYGMVETRLNRAPRPGGYFGRAPPHANHRDLASKTNNFRGTRPNAILTVSQ